MTIQESIKKSSASLAVFIVKEALFCTVYEESAWRFVHAIRPYKPVKKFIKKLGAEVVLLGFPKTELPGLRAIAS
jgi:hypothetical protein